MEYEGQILITHLCGQTLAMKSTQISIKICDALRPVLRCISGGATIQANPPFTGRDGSYNTMYDGTIGHHLEYSSEGLSMHALVSLLFASCTSPISAFPSSFCFQILTDPCDHLAVGSSFQLPFPH